MDLSLESIRSYIESRAHGTLLVAYSIWDTLYFVTFASVNPCYGVLPTTLTTKGICSFGNSKTIATKPLLRRPWVRHEENSC
jgi:hypothetical protein